MHPISGVERGFPLFIEVYIRKMSLIYLFAIFANYQGVSNGMKHADSGPTSITRVTIQSDVPHP